MRYHCVDSGSAGYGIYFPDSMKLIRGNKSTLDLLDKIVGKYTYEELGEDGGSISYENYENFRTMLGEGITHELPPRDSKHLDELIIHVSNDCNMRCLYCYGQGGCYNKKRELMDEGTVIETLDKMYEIYPNIDLINFFGGEPTLNLKVIRTACNYVRLKDKKTILGMVSNGTCASQELIDIIKEFDFKITFSVDMQPMQDVLRPTVNGKSSYETVLKNFKHLREYTCEPSGIEVTYTEMHRKNGVTPANLIKAVREVFGNTTMIFNPVSSCDSRFDVKDLSCFGESVDDLKNEPDIYETTPFIWSVLQRLTEKKPKYHFCSSGFGKTAISVGGDIYPCQAFLGDENYRFGNMKEPIEVLRAKVLEKSDEMYKCNKMIEGQCKDCYLNTFCHRCISNNKMHTLDVGKSPENLCDMQKTVFDKVIRYKIMDMV